MSHGKKLQCAAQVVWVVEPQGIVLIHTLQGRRYPLAYPEAAVWDLLTRSRPVETICTMLELIAAISPSKSKELVTACLEVWTQEGWLEAEASE